jgi:hypothetical protein
MKTKSTFRLVTRYPIKKYKCGLRAGDRLRLKQRLTIRDHLKKPIETREAGEIWTVLKGAKEQPRVLWLRQPDGQTHTWEDNASVFETFEKIN